MPGPMGTSTRETVRERYRERSVQAREAAGRIASGEEATKYVLLKGKQPDKKESSEILVYDAEVAVG